MVYQIANLLRRYRTSFLNISLIAFLAFVETDQENHFEKKNDPLSFKVLDPIQPVQ